MLVKVISTLFISLLLNGLLNAQSPEGRLLQYIRGIYDDTLCKQTKVMSAADLLSIAPGKDRCVFYNVLDSVCVGMLDNFFPIGEKEMAPSPYHNRYLFLFFLRSQRFVFFPNTANDVSRPMREGDFFMSNGSVVGDVFDVNHKLLFQFFISPQQFQEDVRILRQIKQKNNFHVADGQLKSDVYSEIFVKGRFEDVVMSVYSIMAEIDEVHHWEIGPIDDGNRNYFIRKLQLGEL